MFFAASKLGGFLLTPSVLLPLLAGLGVAAAAFGWRGAGLSLTAAALLLTFGLGLGPVPDLLLAPLENRFPPARLDDGRPVAGAIVLGGVVGANISFARDQLVTGEGAERVIAMADLARRFPDLRIVFTGGSGAVVGAAPPEAEAVLRFAPTLGLDPARITIEDRSRTTAENARFTRDLVRPKAGERWLLVTSAWHMPRAVGAFRKAGFAIEPYPVDYRTTGDPPLLMLRASVATGLDDLDLAVKEWLGLLAYRLAGRTEALFPAPSPGPADAAVPAGSSGTESR